MKIINLDARDYHMHTLNFSDGMNTVDELVRYAWEIGLKEIAITDHSQKWIDSHNKTNVLTARHTIVKWRNVLNWVNVIFWIEWDLLDDEWNCCFDIQTEGADFNILSVHPRTFNWKLENITDTYIKAINKYHDKIDFIWHPCLAKSCKYLDVKKLCEVANSYNIPLEFNAKDLYYWRTNLEKQEDLLKYADRLYLNSDAHTLYDLKEMRWFAINYLKENWYIK